MQNEQDPIRYVKINGKPWQIDRQLKQRVRNNVEECKVLWHHVTLEPIQHLANAQRAIADFEGYNFSSLEKVDRIRRRKVLTMGESRFPINSVLWQSDQDYATAQKHVAFTWPHFHPHPSIDLYPAIYRIQMELDEDTLDLDPGRKSYRRLMERPQIRPLEWSSDYVDLAKPYSFISRKRNAILIQATGEEHPEGKCERCLGDAFAPFKSCICFAPDSNSWFNGACANCGSHDNGRCQFYRLKDQFSGESAPVLNLLHMMAAYLCTHNDGENRSETNEYFKR